MTEEKGPEGTTGGGAVWVGLFRNSAVALLCRIITALSAFCLIPFIIGRVGIAGYGLWETIVSLGSIVFLLQSVISSTLLWWMSQAYGRGDHDAIRRSAGIGLACLGLILLVTLPPVWLFREPLAAFIQVPAAELPELSRLLALYLTLSVAGGVTEILAAMVAASQRMGEAQLMQTVGRVANYGCAIALLLAGYGLGSMVIGQAVGSLIYGALLIRTLRRLYPGVRFFPQLPSRGEVTALYRYAGFMAIGSSASLLREQTDKIILAVYASPTWVGYYGIAIRLAMLLLDFNRFFFPPFTAAAAALHARGEWAELCAIYGRVLLTVAVCTGMVFIGVMAGYDRLMLFWLGNSFPQVTEILLLLVLGNSFSVILAGPQSALCRGIGRAGIETGYVVVSIVLNLLATLLLVTLMGPLGTVYASAGSSVVGALLFVWLFHRNLKVPLRALLTAVSAFALALPVAGALRWLFLMGTLPQGRSAALLSLLAGTVPACLLYMGLLLLGGIVTRRELRGFMGRGGDGARTARG